MNQILGTVILLFKNVGSRSCSLPELDHCLHISGCGNIHEGAAIVVLVVFLGTNVRT